MTLISFKGVCLTYISFISLNIMGIFILNIKENHKVSNFLKPIIYKSSYRKKIKDKSSITL